MTPRRFILAIGVAWSLAMAPSRLRAADVTTSLRGLWALDETSGTSAADTSGSSATGTYAGTPQLGNTGRFAKASGFSGGGGTVDRLSLPSTVLNGLTDLTTSFWLKTTNTSGQNTIVSGANSSVDNEYYLYIDSSGLLKIIYKGSTNSLSWDVSSTRDGKWHHFVVVTNYAGGQTAVYVDGVLVSTQTLAPSAALSVGSGGLFLGQDQDTLGGSFDATQRLIGDLDQVRVYGRALSVDDVKQLYSEGGTILHWKLNETSGTTAADSSGLGFDGTVSGTAAWIAGRRHNAFDVNGATKIEATTLVGQPTDFTLACWARIDSSDAAGAEGVSIGDYVVLRPHDAAAGSARGIFYAGGSTWTGVAGTQSYIGRGWHHFAVTFDDAANSIKLWVDGVNVATASTTASVSWSGLGTKTRAGQHGNTRTDYDLDGALDDVRIYNVALTQSEIADLYGLVGRWRLTETSGATAADSSGKGLNGTYVNGPTLAQAGPYPGLGLYAADFDGSNDYVDGSAATSYGFTDGFTIAGWTFLDSFVASSAMLQNGATTQNCELSITGTGQVRVAGRSSGGVQSLTTATTLPTGKWKHVVGSYDGTTFKVYIDGVLDSSTSNAFTVATASGDLTLGASLEGTDEFLDGKLQDVRLYNRALAADEVSELYGLVGYWKLDEGTGTALADSSGAGANAAFDSGAPAWTTAIRNTGLSFNGTSDSAITSESFSPPSVGTVAFWFKSNGPPAARARFFGLGGDWEAWQDPDGIVRWDLCGDGEVGGFKTVSAPADAGRWYHVIAMFDSADESYAIYVNGVLDKSGTSTVNLVDQAAAQLSFGTRTGSTQRFTGVLDDLRVYNRKISATEIADVYGLVGHWKFNEGAGTTAADSSGYQNNATLSGATWTNNGVGDNAGDFNGTGGVATTIKPFTPPSAGSVAFWLKASGPIAAGTQARLFGVNGDWEGRQQPDGSIHFDIGASPFAGNEPFSTVIAVDKKDRWIHVAAVFDASDDSYAVYVNGELQASGISPVNLIPQTAAALVFGNRAGTTEYWKGALRDFRIYNRKLSQPDVMELYGMVGWYKLDETSGTIAADSTGLGHPGAFTGGPTLNVAANGAPSQGTAVAFSGSNSVQISGLYDKTANVSATAWVRLDGADASGADVISLGDDFRLRLNSGTDGASVAYYNGSSEVVAASSLPTLNTGWRHYAAVLRNDALKLYLDGVEVASTAVSGSIAYVGRGSNSRIASHGNGGTTTDLTGRIDDVRVYNRALTPLEVFYQYRGSRINGLRILKWIEAR